MKLALMCVDPAAVASARPAEPAALLMVAAAGLEEDHVTCAVRFCFVRSEKTPVAVNCAVVPFAALRFGGVTSSVIRTAGVTTSFVWPMIPLLVAEMVVAPALTAVAIAPDAAELLMVAAALSDEAQTAWEVTSLWVPSLNTAIAVRLVVVPAASCGLTGVI